MAVICKDPRPCYLLCLGKRCEKTAPCSVCPALDDTQKVRYEKLKTVAARKKTHKSVPSSFTGVLDFRCRGETCWVSGGPTPTTDLIQSPDSIPMHASAPALSLCPSYCLLAILVILIQVVAFNRNYLQTTYKIGRAIATVKTFLQFSFTRWPWHTMPAVVNFSVSGTYWMLCSQAKNP